MKLSVDIPMTLIVALLYVAILLIGSEVTTATSSTDRTEEEELQQQKETPSLRGWQQLDVLNSEKLDELRPSSPSLSFDDDVDAAHTASASAWVDTGASSGDCSSITDTVCAMEGVTVFCELLKNETSRRERRRDLADSLVLGDSDSVDDENATSTTIGASSSGSSSSDDGEDFASAFGFDDDSEEFTLFVPTDAAFSKISSAFETLSDLEAVRVILFHLYQGMMLTSDKLDCGEKITSMNENSDASRTKCTSDGKKYQNGNGNTKTGTMPEIDTADTMACNGVVHTLDSVMFPVSLSQLHADSSASELTAMPSSFDEYDAVAPIAPTNDDERMMNLSNETVSDDFLNNETDSFDFDFAEEEEDGTMISNYSLSGSTSKSMKSAKKSKGIDYYTTLPPTDSMSDINVTDDFIDFVSEEDDMLSNYSLSGSRSKSMTATATATTSQTNAPNALTPEVPTFFPTVTLPPFSTKFVPTITKNAPTNARTNAPNHTPTDTLPYTDSIMNDTVIEDDFIDFAFTNDEEDDMVSNHSSSGSL